MPRKKKTTAAKAAKLSERAVAVQATDRKRYLLARYDNAVTTIENRRHWANASDLAPDLLGAPDVRRILRQRGRYTCRNNSWAAGIRDTLANDTIGTGPRLQMLTDDPELNTKVEVDFANWAEEINLAEKLRTMRAARVEAGEIFGLMASNPGLISDVKLDMTLVESEQVQSPFGLDPATRLSDGIEYDDNGNPTRYWVMKDFPGTTYTAIRAEDFDQWPARFVLHYFRPTRPGQSRGVPDLTPALDIFEEMRRYSKAVLLAAEVAADHALVIESDLPADGSDSTTVEAMDTFELTRGMATTLPPGTKLNQVRSEQPVNTYDKFVMCKVGEAARCLNVPYYVAALDTAAANMSSTYVVGQKYERTITVDRSDLERLLNRLVDVWLTEWILINRPTVPARINRVWQWDKIGNHADPEKVANARVTELSNGVTSFPREYAKDGLDWEDEQETAAKSLGVPVEKYRELLTQKLFGPTTQPVDTGTQGAGAGDAAELERIKAESDAYGVGVRAGVITPQSVDETQFRERLKLPPLSAEAKKAWADDKGVRRPITLTQSDGTKAPPPGQGVVIKNATDTTTDNTGD